MKPLIVLISASIIATLAIKFFNGNYYMALAARIGMSAMLIFTSIGHFAFTKGMSMMLPDFIPFKKTVIYVTGIIEIVAAVGLLVATYTFCTGWFLIVFFVLLLPANIYAAIKQVDYQKGTYEGAGVNYLWFRVPLQILFIVWVYLSAINQ